MTPILKTSDDHTVARDPKHCCATLHKAERSWLTRLSSSDALSLTNHRTERFLFSYAEFLAMRCGSCVERPRGLKPAAQKIKEKKKLWKTQEIKKTNNGIVELGFLFALVVMLASPLAAYAQSKQLLPTERHSRNVKAVAAPKAHRRVSPITRWVPASTKLFIRVRELDKVDASLQRTHAWQLLPLIAGQPINTNRSFLIRDALVNFLGIASSANSEALAKSEIGIVATSWLELPHAVWIVKLPGANVLEEWFPIATRVGDREIGLAKLFRTRTGLSICARGRFVALARRGADQRTLQRIRSLMVGQRSTTKPLSLSTSYRELMTYLPGQDIAHAYFSLSSVNATASEPQTSETPTPNQLEGTALVGMFDRGDHIDFTFRLSQTTPTQMTPLADETLERMAKLPSTTIAAIATTFDFADYYDRTLARPANSPARRYIQLLQGLGHGTIDQSKLIKSLGPDVLIVWDSGGHLTAPQLHLAVMVKCPDARQFRTEFTYLAANLLQVLQIFEPPDSPNEPTLELNRHLGLPYIYVDWQAYSENAKIPTIQQFKQTSPAWTAWGDWFVFALDRDHLERLIDARYGIRDTIDNDAEVNPLSLQKNNTTTAALIRTGLAARFVQTWLGRAGTPKASLLASSWWSNNQSTDAKRTSGLGFTAAAQNEDVVVQSVDTHSLAAGLLQVGDRIRGVDGSLLSMTDPVSDLTLRLTSKTKVSHRLRVQREGQWMEVKLPNLKADRESSRDNPVDAAIIALREFARLGQTFQETFIAIHAPSDRTTSAKLTIKLKPIAADIEKTARPTAMIPQ